MVQLREGDVAAVFGGAGFIGRQVVARLANRGLRVRVAGRDPERAAALKPMGRAGQIVPLWAAVNNPDAVARACAGASVVVNLVGILSEARAGDFTRVMTEGAGCVARAAAAAGAKALVHLSAIGAAADAPAAYARAKAAGEAAVRAAFPSSSVLRPSVVFGPDDRFLTRIAALARVSPLMPVICGATKLQPVYVGDVADAVLAALQQPVAAGQTFELGGPEVLAFRALVERVLAMIERPRRLVEAPAALVRLAARLGELIPGKPLTRDQLLLLARDNVVAAGAPGLAELGVTPSPIGLVMAVPLARFRPPGGALRFSHAS
jgi:NADH dehydrogenase